MWINIQRKWLLIFYSQLEIEDEFNIMGSIYKAATRVFVKSHQVWELNAAKMGVKIEIWQAVSQHFDSNATETPVQFKKKLWLYGHFFRGFWHLFD